MVEATQYLYPVVYWPLAVGYTFEPSSVHTAKVRVRNPSTVSFSYTAELYLGKYEGDKKATKSVSFTLTAGQEKDVDFSITMPAVQDIYHVYLDIYHEGTVIAKYTATQDVQVYTAPKIEIISIIWV